MILLGLDDNEVSSNEIEKSNPIEATDDEKEEKKSEIPDNYHMEIDSEDDSENDETNENSNEVKKSEIPEKPSSDKIVSTDSYPLRLRIYPPS